jgi:outer membrane lipoprotein carrier protein
MAAAIIFTTLLGVEAQPPGAPPIDQLVHSLQLKYNSVRDFSADFEHQYTGGLLNISLVEHGTVLIKKPGKMRWNYVTAEEKLYVSNGETFYSYFPRDRQVIMTEIPPDDRGSTPMSFLAGRGNLSEDFDVTYEDISTSPDNWVRRLTPRVPDAGYEWLVVTVDRSNLSITGLSTSDFQGGKSTYIFTGLKENQNLPDSAFEFTVPDEIDIVSNRPLLN